MMGSSQYTCMKNRPTYKEKWGTIFGDYKKMQDYMVGTSHKEEFWNIHLANRTTLNLQRLIYKVIYEMIDAFMSSWPISELSHS
jgi:hypothetical protein